jgi:hypothetical protein
MLLPETPVDLRNVRKGGAETKKSIVDGFTSSFWTCTLVNREDALEIRLGQKTPP